MNLYETVFALSQFEGITKELRAEKGGLTQAFSRERPNTERILQRAVTYSGDLREIGNYYLTQPKRKVNHRLEDFWSEEKIKDFDGITKQLDFSQDPALRYIKRSIILRKKDKLVATHGGLGRKFAGGFIGMGFGEAVGAIIGATIISKPEDMLITFGLDITLGAFLGVIYFSKIDSIINPFESVANEIDQRTNFISDYLEKH